MQIEDEVFAIINETFEYNWEEYQDGTKGSFFKALADAFDLADMPNLAKLADAFPEVYKKYAEYHGDTLKRLEPIIVDYKGLKNGKTYRLLQDLNYGDAVDYIQALGLGQADRGRVKDITNLDGEIIIPAGSYIKVEQIADGYIMIDFEGLDFDCVFDNDVKFEEVI